MIGRRSVHMLAAAIAMTSAIAVATPAHAVPPAAGEIDDETVRRAIDAMVAELLSRKHPERFWEPSKIPAGESTTQGGGHTALVTLSLMYAGLSYQDPRISDAIEYLEQLGADGTYAVAIRAHVWAMLPPRFEERLAAETKWLVDSFSERSRCWYYTPRPNTDYEDNSIRQYGTLALWEASKRGIEVDTGYWRMLEEAFVETQLADGSWNYRLDSPGTGSMTTAGLAVLFITQDELHAAERVELGGGSGGTVGPAIDRGLAWMEQNFTPSQNPGRDTYLYYYLYGVERVGLASGYKFFGEHDWFREGAAELMERMIDVDEDGVATVNERTFGKGNAAVIHDREIAFALMFLSRGRVPVAINKLQVDGMAWNNRPRDVANLTRWIRRTGEKALSWQIVSLDADPRQWLDAPVLYMASNEPAPWMGVEGSNVATVVRDAAERRRIRAAGAPSDGPAGVPLTAEARKIKTYIDLGGMLLAVNEGKGRQFAESIERLGLLMYPHYTWRTLPDDHWAYSIQFPSRRPPLRGLSNGVRELIILSEGADLARSFQAGEDGEADHFKTVANAYLYASEVNRPRPRLAVHAAPTPADPPAASATVVRAVYDGNWNPEPQALQVFADTFAATRSIGVEIVDHPLVLIDALTPPPALVVVSGTEAQEFDDAQRDALRGYVERGGVVLFETAGGRGDFTLSAERMATETFSKPIRSLLRSDVISGDGFDDAPRLTRVEYRPYAFEVFGGQERAPRIRGMYFDGTPRVLFSREDMSHALLDQPCWGVSGYRAGSARDLLGNILQAASRTPPVR